MQRLEVSCAVRLIFMSLGAKGLMYFYPLPDDGRMERPKRRGEIIIKARLVFGYCICANWLSLY